MKIIEPGFEILMPQELSPETRDAIYQMMERAGRTCYKSEDRITPESAAKFVRMLVRSGHEAMLEHASMTVKFIVDRGISHELVRHRLASFAQESQRYCDYSQSKFSGEITFIRPFFLLEDSVEYRAWKNLCQEAEDTYLALKQMNYPPQEARCVLPNSVKTEVIMTANMREWRHFLKLRAAGETGAPHPQMLQVTVPLLEKLREAMPELFDDIVPMEARR